MGITKYIYILNIYAVRQMVSEKKISKFFQLYFWELMTPGAWPIWTPVAWPIWTPVAWLAAFRGHTKYITCWPHGFREEYLFQFSHFKSMGADDP